ncbi:MAG: type II toxin-antitoxin system VapC family toxin [Dehalococcoidia bacterium]
MNRRAMVDTHAWIWGILGGPSRLNDEARSWFDDRNAELFISTASLWEIAIKVSLGKLNIGPAGVDGLEESLKRSRMETLPIELRHVVGAGKLRGKGDPFDRMLACQSRIEGLPIITADRAILELGPAGVIWAG